MYINPRNNKILFFSDLHLGVHRSSNAWHDISLNAAHWIKSVMEERYLDTIILAGDVFENRHEINVNTIHVAKRFFDILKDYKIHILVGNHDAFLSNSVTINSIEILAKDNIFVYTVPTTITAGNSTLTLCPWKTNVSELPQSDMIVGHFDIINFKLTATRVCEHGHASDNLFEKSRRIVSGHFHCRQHKVYEDGSYILYLGSPYEMNFGDIDQPRGVSIINMDNLDEIEFIENPVSPKHFRIKVSDLIQKKYKDLPKIVKGNIISVYVDIKIDTLTLDLLTKKLSQYEPLQFRTEFDVLDNAQQEAKDIKKLSIDVETAFHEFIDHVETRATKKEVLDKCLELYKICRTSYE